MATKKTFESSLEELQTIINEFQNGDVSLNESVKLYKKALTLISFCEKEITNAKSEIEYINKESEENEQ